jgi:hypothetical protein
MTQDLMNVGKFCAYFGGSGTLSSAIDLKAFRNMNLGLSLEPDEVESRPADNVRWMLYAFNDTQNL